MELLFNEHRVSVRQFSSVSVRQFSSDETVQEMDSDGGCTTL